MRMNLINIYGPTLTLPELLKIMKISRTSYYNYIKNKDGNPHYKKGFPKPIPGYSRNRFITRDVEAYLDSLRVLA